VHRLTDREETTILLTTHDLDEAEKLADRILVLVGGRIVADGSAAELTRSLAGGAEVRYRLDGEPIVHAAPTAPATSGSCSPSTAEGCRTWRCAASAWRTPTSRWCAGAAPAAPRLAVVGA
jgi:ABC-type multidrug transport system ATPase subunit